MVFRPHVKLLFNEIVGQAHLEVLIVGILMAPVRDFDG